MKKIFIILSFLFLLISCGEIQQAQESTTQNAQPTLTNNVEEIQDEQQILLVTSSIIPISSVIKAIGQEYVEVDNIIPAGVSPHGFDMSAQQRARLEAAELVFMTWLDHIDGFLEKSVSEDVQIHLADGMELLEMEAHDHDDHKDHEDEHSDEEHHDEDEEEHHDEDEHEGEKHHDDHSSDPHVWLGKDNIMTIAQSIETELTERLPGPAAYFSENRQKFETELSTIYNEFTENTQWKTPQEFIVFHDAYNYIFESIGLDANLKIPFSENVLHDTWTAHMAELIDEIKLHDIKYIFREPQFSDTNLNTLIDEYGLSVHTLDPLGTDISAEGYFMNLRNNLDALKNIYE